MGECRTVNQSVGRRSGARGGGGGAAMGGPGPASGNEHVNEPARTVQPRTRQIRPLVSDRPLYIYYSSPGKEPSVASSPHNYLPLASNGRFLTGVPPVKRPTELIP